MTNIKMDNLDKFRLGKISTPFGLSTQSDTKEDSHYHYGVCSKCDYIYERLVDFYFADCGGCGSRECQRSLTEHQFLNFIGDLRIKKINFILENG